MPTFSDKQALDFLSRLFPAGLKDPDLLAEVCPDGWEASPLWLIFHPTPEQRYAEHLSWLRNPMHELIQRNEGTQAETPPTFEEFLATEDEEDRKQQQAMARDLAAAKGRALDEAPPATVLAYQEVYGKDPHHWPPDPDSPD